MVIFAFRRTSSILAATLVCSLKEHEVHPDDFRCYLVAHSMGGLVVWASLQNPKLGKDAPRQVSMTVNSVFTKRRPLTLWVTTSSKTNRS